MSAMMRFSLSTKLSVTGVQAYFTIIQIMEYANLSFLSIDFFVNLGYNLYCDKIVNL